MDVFFFFSLHLFLYCTYNIIIICNSENGVARCIGHVNCIRLFAAFGAGADLRRIMFYLVLALQINATRLGDSAVTLLGIMYELAAA